MGARKMEFKYNSIEMAEMQLDRALRLFYEGDVVSALALGSRALDILEEMAEAEKLKVVTFKQSVKGNPTGEAAWKRLRTAERVGKHYGFKRKKRVPLDPMMVERRLLNAVGLFHGTGREMPPAIAKVASIIHLRLLQSIPADVATEARARVLKFLATAGVDPESFDLRRFREEMAVLPPSWTWEGVERPKAKGKGADG